MPSLRSMTLLTQIEARVGAPKLGVNIVCYPCMRFLRHFGWYCLRRRVGSLTRRRDRPSGNFANAGLRPGASSVGSRRKQRR
jgi:hypothetical protein